MAETLSSMLAKLQQAREQRRANRGMTPRERWMAMVMERLDQQERRIRELQIEVGMLSRRENP